ncbi:hypothetical protein BD779DRAFT_378831 [Infundibulicybe gibba]|nr:hypothetical protein BD779DRAFT_378831 [Infundibulicybe gibba]
MDNQEPEFPTQTGLNQLSRNIESLPKIDKRQFITSYIGAQKTHLKQYASQGLAVMLSWNKSTVATENSPPRNSAILPTIEFGFGTPILKSRVEKKTLTTEYTSVSLGKKEEITPQASSISTPQKPEIGRARPKPSIDGATQPLAKRGRPRAASLNSDEDTNNRLKDRRERKRIRKAITKPTDEVSADKMAETCRSRTQCKGKKERIPPGFALMYGFSATNVGKNRLTPPMVVGVFNKGKASERTVNKGPKQTFLRTFF